MSENVFYVSQKALLVVKMKLKNEEELTKELLQTFAYPGDHEDDQMLLPIDLGTLDAHFPEQASLVDADGQLDLERLIQKLGLKGTGEALVQAQQAFLQNLHEVEPELRAQPMQVSQWTQLWADYQGADFIEEGFECFEEEVIEEDEEVNVGEDGQNGAEAAAGAEAAEGAEGADGDGDGDGAGGEEGEPEPALKKAKKA